MSDTITASYDETSGYVALTIHGIEIGLSPPDAARLVHELNNAIHAFRQTIKIGKSKSIVARFRKRRRNPHDIITQPVQSSANLDRLKIKVRGRKSTDEMMRQ